MAPKPKSWTAVCGVVMGGLDTLEEMLMCCWAGVQTRQLVLDLVDIPAVPWEEVKNGASSTLLRAASFFIKAQLSNLYLAILKHLY